MATVTCPRCLGTGRYAGRSSYGNLCFRCNGTGRATIRVRTYTPPTPPNTLPIETICGGDPTLYHRLSNPAAALASCGITAEQLAHYADLYRAGVRVVPNPFLPA